MQGVAVTIRSLYDYQDIPEILEDGNSFFQNALKKARIVSERTGEIALADDSGLEVDALSGAPGIHSARYACDDATDNENISKLLKNMKHVKGSQRKARFHCVLVLYLPTGHFECFEGQWQGLIADQPSGTGGFGYDPVFFLPDRSLTVAQIGADLKNLISHRAEAFRKLRAYLQHVGCNSWAKQ